MALGPAEGLEAGGATELELPSKGSSSPTCAAKPEGARIGGKFRIWV